MNKPKVRTTTSAVVTLTIEISNVGSWGPDCQIVRLTKFIVRRARLRACGYLRHLMVTAILRLLAFQISGALPPIWT